MITIVTYIEEIRKDWREYDAMVLANLQSTFGVDTHYFVARNEADEHWFYEKPHRATSGGFRKACIPEDRVPRLTDLMVLQEHRVVNVQPMTIFQAMGLSWDWLQEYRHPDDACYIFGPNHGMTPFFQPGARVAIDVERSSLYAASAVAMVLYDRRAKYEIGARSRPAS